MNSLLNPSQNSHAQTLFTESKDMTSACRVGSLLNPPPPSTVYRIAILQALASIAATALSMKVRSYSEVEMAGANLK